MQVEGKRKEEKKKSDKHLLGLNPCQDLKSKGGEALHRIEPGSH